MNMHTHEKHEQVHGKEDLAGPDSPHKAQTWSRYVAPLARHHNITAAGQAWCVCVCVCVCACACVCVCVCRGRA
jgi:hypothetical protein